MVSLVAYLLNTLGFGFGDLVVAVEKKEKKVLREYFNLFFPSITNEQLDQMRDLSIQPCALIGCLIMPGQK